MNKIFLTAVTVLSVFIPGVSQKLQSVSVRTEIYKDIDENKAVSNHFCKILKRRVKIDSIYNYSNLNEQPFYSNNNEIILTADKTKTKEIDVVGSTLLGYYHAGTIISVTFVVTVTNKNHEKIFEKNYIKRETFPTREIINDLEEKGIL